MQSFTFSRLHFIVSITFYLFLLQITFWKVFVGILYRESLIVGKTYTGCQENKKYIIVYITLLLFELPATLSLFEVLFIGQHTVLKSEGGSLVGSVNACCI